MSTGYGGHFFGNFRGRYMISMPSLSLSRTQKVRFPRSRCPVWGYILAWRGVFPTIRGFGEIFESGGKYFGRFRKRGICLPGNSGGKLNISVLVFEDELEKDGGFGAKKARKFEFACVFADLNHLSDRWHVTSGKFGAVSEKEAQESSGHDEAKCPGQQTAPKRETVQFRWENVTFFVHFE